MFIYEPQVIAESGKTCVKCKKSLNQGALAYPLDDNGSKFICSPCLDELRRKHPDLPVGKPKRLVGKVTATAEQLRGVDFAVIEKQMIDSAKREGYRLTKKSGDEYIFEDESTIEPQKARQL
jgi:hypothetical protein